MRIRLLLSLLTFLPCPPLSIYLSGGNSLNLKISMGLWVMAVAIFLFLFFGPGFILWLLAGAHALISFANMLYRPQIGPFLKR